MPNRKDVNNVDCNEHKKRIKIIAAAMVGLTLIGIAWFAFSCFTTGHAVRITMELPAIMQAGRWGR